MLSYTVSLDVHAGLLGRRRRPRPEQSVVVLIRIEREPSDD
jgi:hypothetical protein